MTLKTSLIITGDASVARKEVQDLTQAIITAAASTRAAAVPAAELDAAQQRTATSARAEAAAVAGAGASMEEMARSAREATTAQGAAAAAARQYEAELTKLRTELDPAGEAQRRLARDIDLANTALARGIITQGQYDGHLKKLNATTNEAASASARHQFGMRNLGQQFGDFATQVSRGGGVVRAFSSQAGQMGYALSEMGGVAGKFGAFMTGPWGIALTIGALALGPLLDALGATEDKTKSLQNTEEEYGRFQGNLANFIDAANGKLRDRVGLLAQIALQEGKGEIVKSNREASDLSKSAFDVAKGAGAKTALAGTPFAYTVVDPAVQRSIDAAGGSVLKLRDAFNELAKTRPEFQAAADKINHLGGQALFAANNSAKLKARQEELTVALHGGTIASVALIDRQVAAETATTALEKAQVRLNEVKARGAAIELELYGPKRSADLAKYHADVVAATKAVKAAQDAAKDAGKAGFATTFLSPVAGGRITTRFGERESGRGEAGSHVHAGVDYAVPVGTAIRAPAAGTVDVAGQRSGYGNAIYINFGAGTEGRFGHLSKFNVKPGDTVNAGDVIGFTGGAAGAPGSGDSTGPHLHYEVRRNGRAVDPTKGCYATDAGSAGDDAQRRQEAADKSHEAALARQAELVRSSGNTIESINASWGDQATLVARAVAPTNQLNDIIAKLGKEKPLGFEKLIADAQVAKGVIQDGIQRPYNDFIEAQSVQIGHLALIRQGRQDEADAMETIVALERQQGPLSLAQKDAVLATVQARKAEQREIDVLHEKNQKYLDAIGSIKSAVEDATQAFVRGDLGQFIKTPGKLLDAFQTLKGQQIFDKLFDGAFRELQDQVNGTSAVRGMAAAANTTSGSFRDLQAASSGLAAAWRGSGGQGSGTSGGTPGGSIASVLGANFSAVLADPRIAAALGLKDVAARAATTGVDGDVVVTGRRDPFQSAMTKIGTSIVGLFTNKDNAKAIGQSIGDYSSRAFAGAATGSMISGFGNALGIKNSSTGAQLGGAIGGIIPGLPPGIGSIIGSLAGGLIGNLLAPNARPGGATVSGSGGEAGVTGSVGSDKASIAAGTGLGGQVASTINQVVQQLGGTLGDFNVQIGKYKDDLRVNVNGKALGGVKGSGAVGFGDDQNAAVSYAAGQAIAQGAIQGVSDAVAKALRSSSDLDKSLKEALKVQNLELTIGGIAAQINKSFRDLEATAKDRVRIASQYGFDVVAIEKKNADDRVKLADQLLKQQVGSLQSLVDEMTRGSLFEGSALDRIAALNTAIGKAKVDLNAGVDGAADTLANLYQQRLSASKEAYGTTVEYAADRNSTLNEARAAIAKANAQIAAAQNKSDPALTTTNAALDENNDQNAQIISAVTQTNQLLTQLPLAAGLAA